MGMDVLYRARVRLAGINAPERGTLAGDAATRYVTDLLPAGTEITVISHRREKYGRILGAIKLPDGRDLGALLLEAGHAVPYDGGRQ
jgi:endonuclease YncB( thermonuclease family)